MWEKLIVGQLYKPQPAAGSLLFPPPAAKGIELGGKQRQETVHTDPCWCRLVPGPWDVISLVGKNPELVRDVERFRLDIVGSTLTLCSGTRLVENACTLSQVPSSLGWLRGLLKLLVTGPHLQRHMGVWDSVCGLMWWCAPVVRLSQPPWGSLLWGAREEASADRQTSDPGRAAWISPWLWNGRPALPPLVPAGANWDFAHLVYMCFMDLEKAYNQVPWEVL